MTNHADRGRGERLEPWYCPQCLKDTKKKMGVAVEINISPTLRNKKIDKRMGRKRWVCALCLGRGLITYVE